MKKGFMKCPFCANEIKEGAIKCQYCEEFLDGRNDKYLKKGNNNSSSKKSFFDGFFRKNLELNKKWRHRLIKIIWCLSILFCCMIGILIIADNYPEYEPSFEFKGYITDRINTTESVVSSSDLANLVKDGEYLFPYCSTDNIVSLDRLLRGDNWIKNEVHLCCAKEWNTDTVLGCLKQKWAPGGFYGKGSHRGPNGWGWSVGEVLNNIGNVSCMEGIKDNGETYVSFDDWGIIYDPKAPCIFTYKEANKFIPFITWLLISVLGFAIGIALYCIITMIIYYKGIIYIIYGSDNK